MSHSAAIVPRLRLYTPRLMARRDWNEIKERIDLARVAAGLLGAPIERRGLRTASLRWHCPFESGRTPAFQVNQGETSWSCFTCGSGGDAAALVMRFKGMAFRDAIAWLDEHEDFRSCEFRRDDQAGFIREKHFQVLHHLPSSTRNRPGIMVGGDGLMV